MVPGRLRAVADDVLVCRFASPSAFPVPLGIAGRPGSRLAGWAVARGGGPETALSYLLVIEGDTSAAGSIEDGPLGLDTHFGPLTIAVEAGELVLTAVERAALAHAALAARLGGSGADALLGIVAGALDELIAAGETDALGLAREGDALVIDGAFVPEWIVLRGPDGYRRFAAATATLRFAGRPSVTIVPDQSWSPALLTGAAILVGGGTHRVGRLRGGRAP